MPDILELELQAFVRNCVGAGVKPRFSARAASSFNCRTISPALRYTPAPPSINTKRQNSPILLRTGLDENTSSQGREVGIEDVKVKDTKTQRVTDRSRKTVPGGSSRGD